jgi:hypothetical protein
VRIAPVPPPLIVCRCSVPSRSFLLGPSALRGLHLDNPCAPAMIAATAEPEHNEYPPSGGTSRRARVHKMG